jgi:general secretion pathway protein G
MRKTLEDVMDRKSKTRSRRAGFTLIELLLVVVIIGILAAIVVPRLTGRADDARIAAAKQQMAIFKNMLETYHMDNGFFPTSDQKLDALVMMPTGEPQPKKWKKLLNGDIVPLDPWGNPYVYISDGQNYDVSCMGADGQEGTEDDIRP